MLLVDKINGGTLIVDTDTELVDNQWAHIVCTYDGSGSLSGIKFYINGNPVSTTSMPASPSPNFYASMGSTSTDVLIGSFTSSNGGFRSYIGSIDEVYLFNKILTQSEINLLYQDPEPSSSFTNLYEDSDGDIGIGTTSPSSILEIIDGDPMEVKAFTTAGNQSSVFWALNGHYSYGYGIGSDDKGHIFHDVNSPTPKYIATFDEKLFKINSGLQIGEAQPNASGVIEEGTLSYKDGQLKIFHAGYFMGIHYGKSLRLSGTPTGGCGNCGTSNQYDWRSSQFTIIEELNNRRFDIGIAGRGVTIGNLNMNPETMIDYIRFTALIYANNGVKIGAATPNTDNNIPAGTIEFKNGQFWVYNIDNQPVELGGGLSEGLEYNEARNQLVINANEVYPGGTHIQGKVAIGDVYSGTGQNGIPAEFDLAVGGNIIAQKIKVAYLNTAEWQDKVFAKDYPLLSLDSVQTYITENNHLPGVPSAEEVVENGVEITEITATLLGKIEELTLYILQQEARIKQLELQAK